MTCANFTEVHDHVNTWPGPLLGIREGLMPARDSEAYAVLVLWSICLGMGTLSVLKTSHKHLFEKNLFIYYVPDPVSETDKPETDRLSANQASRHRSFPEGPSPGDTGFSQA